MFETCKRKKLLIIGVEENESIIKAAHDMGVYAICIDRNADRFNCEAVRIADEIWKMDYSDISSVVEKCREAGVTGVMTGYSEFKVSYAARISEALGVPFYATVEQIEITRNKRKFKDLCIKYHVPIAKDYCFANPLTEDEKEAVHYPVIVKPTDYAGCKGITVCYNRSQLNKAIAYALEFSASRTIICEDYIVGTELMAIYTLKDGEISLSSLSEKYISRDHERISGLCDAVVAPSRYYEKYIQETDGPIRDLLLGIDAKNGMAFFQFIANEEGITAFEMGYRLNGNNDCCIIEKYNNINYMKMMISYSLTGDMGDDLKKDNPLFDRYLCTLCTYLNAGVVDKVDYGQLEDRDWVDDIYSYVTPGKVITDDDSTQRRGVFVKLNGKTIEELAARIKEVQAMITITDTEGKNMLFKPFDTGRLG